MISTRKGVWSLINSFHVLSALLETEVDFVVLDLEHGHWRSDQIATAVSICRQNEKQSVLRIPSIKQEYFQLAQDSAVDIIQIAGVTSSRDLDAITKKVEYYPYGTLGHSPWTFGGRRSTPEAAFSPRICIQIENQDFLNDFIQGKVELPKQITSIFIGRYDLSLSMGISGDVAHPRILGLLEMACIRAREESLQIGTVSPAFADFQVVSKLGMNFVSLSSDVQKILTPTP